jgi:protein ImuB
MFQRPENMLTPLERREHGTLRRNDQPVILVAEGPRGGRVVACSAAAAEKGVHISMPVAEAKSLVPHLTIAPYDPAADRWALEQLADACERFSPCVALEEGDAPECLLMDISNLEHLWGSEAQLAARVEAFFTKRGWRVRLAVAPTVGMAWGMAHANDELRMTNDETKSSGHSSFVIRHSSLASSLPIEALRIPPDTAALLRELGIETVGHLLALPRGDLSSRLGESLLKRIDQWTGAAAEVLVPHRAPAALAVGEELEEPTGDRAALTHVLTQLVDDLAARLAARDQGAVLLVCELGCASGQPVQFSVGLFEPSASARQLLELVGLHLETITLTDEVTRVSIRAATVGRLGQRQGELFAGEWPSDPHQLAFLVNRLASRLGREQVLRAELRASALPERAVRWVPMTDSKWEQDKETRIENAECRMPNVERKNSDHSSFVIRHSGIPPRPLLLYPQPRPIDVTCVAPHGPPQCVWLAGRRERVAHHWGPERIETLWWRGLTVRRDYYRAALESGGHLWLFRRLSDGRWFLHGVFT